MYTEKDVEEIERSIGLLTLQQCPFICFAWDANNIVELNYPRSKVRLGKS